jgi:hypothetical protein
MNFVRLGWALAAVLFVLGGCDTARPATSVLPTDPPCDLAHICMSYGGQRYEAKGPTWVLPQPTWYATKAAFGYFLPPDMTKIGSAELVTANVGEAGFDILRIPGVDPSDAVASPMLAAFATAFADETDPPTIFMWVRVGLDLGAVRGFCVYEVPNPCATP